MYQITCDGYVLHDARIDELKVINAKCSLEVNKTGLLTFQIHPIHPYYNVIKKHTSQITLYQDDRVLFRGRVLNDDVTFEKIKTIECEGDLSFLLDSIQRKKSYTLKGTTNNVETYLTDLITIHNSQVDDYKKFKIGNITVTDNSENLILASKYEDTLSLVNTNLIDKFGGYISIRYVGNDKYIDYLSDCIGTCNQIIQFGQNIIDMKTNIKGENIYTALIAVGKKYSLSSIANGTYEGFVKESDYIYSPEAVEKYGWIWKYINYSSIETKDALMQSAIADLKSHIDTQLTLELTALDLHLLDVSIDRIEVGNAIRCISLPHNIDLMMFVNAMTINLDDPSKTTVKLVLLEQSQNLIQDTLTDNVNKNSPKNDNDDQYQEEFDNVNKEIDKINTDIGDINQGMDDIKQWVSDNFYPATGGEVDLSDYAKTADVDTKINDLKGWTDNNYVPRNSVSDLSAYAKIVDVNNAFDELATAIEGV